MCFGGLELHGHFDIFFLIINQSGLGQVQQPITNFRRPWDDFIVHGVNHLSLTVKCTHPFPMGPPLLMHHLTIIGLT